MNRRPGAQAAASRSVSGSAPDRTVRTPAVCSGSRTSSNDGTTLAACTPARWVMAASSPGSDRSAPAAMTRVAPAVSETATSRTEASKLNDANCSTRVAGAAPSTGRSAVAMLTTLAWPTATPLGRPVEPEV